MSMRAERELTDLSFNAEEHKTTVYKLTQQVEVFLHWTYLYCCYGFQICRLTIKWKDLNKVRWSETGVD